jgi:hypothetical protein
MIKKISLATNETRKILDSVLKTKKGSVPLSFVKEIEEFVLRNTLEKGQCCFRCFKAHILKKAKIHGLNKSWLDEATKYLECESGHNGYYLDKGKLLITYSK